MTDVMMADGSVVGSVNSLVGSGHLVGHGPNNSVISVTMPGAGSPTSMLQNSNSGANGGTGANGNSGNSAAVAAAAVAAAAAAAAAQQQLNNTQSVADYLAQLLKDKKQLAALPNVFHHVERLLDEEIGKVRGNLFQINGHEKKPMVLPEPIGPVVNLSEKVYVPVKEFPDFNFVGRILGPRGMTAKQLEQETGCKIMVRGRGSMRDKKKEEQNRGKPNWEHLNDELHVLITVEDTENRAKVKLQRAVDEIKKLLVPAADGEDELKKRQLMELAIINGTYRDPSAKLGKGTDLLSIYYSEERPQIARSNTPSAIPCLVSVLHAPRLLTPGGVGPLGSPAGALRNANTAASQLESWNGIAGAPLILSPRGLGPHTSASAISAALLNSAAASGAPPPLISAAEAAAATGLLYSPYAAAAAADYSNYAAAAAAAAGLSSQLLAEYQPVPTSNDATAGVIEACLTTGR